MAKKNKANEYNKYDYFAYYAKCNIYMVARYAKIRRLEGVNLKNIMLASVIAIHSLTWLRGV